MNCNDVRENLIELLTDGPADPQVKAHVSQCGACTEELGSLRKTLHPAGNCGHEQTRL
jgi:hypothetical protein